MDPAVFATSGSPRRRERAGWPPSAASSPTSPRAGTCAAPRGSSSVRFSSPATWSWSRGSTGWPGTSRKGSGPSRSCTPRAFTSAPLRRAWTPETTAPPHASCSTCCYPSPSGSVEPSGTGSAQASTAPRPKAGPGACPRSGVVSKTGWPGHSATLAM